MDHTRLPSVSASIALLFSIFFLGISAVIVTADRPSIISNDLGASIAQILATTSPIVVIEGDDLSHLQNSTTTSMTDWVSHMEGKVIWYDQATKYVVAAPGEPVSLMVSEYASEVHSHKPLGGQKGYLLLFAGSNDVRMRTPTAEQIYANLKIEWAAAKADGFNVIAFTIPPVCQGYLDSVPGEKCNEASTLDKEIVNAKRAALNFYILSDPTLYDVLVRPDLALNNPMDTRFFTDNLHTTEAGAEFLAGEVARTIQTLPQ